MILIPYKVFCFYFPLGVDMLGHLTMMLHIVFLHRLGNVFQEDFLRNLKAPALCILISVILIKELVTQLLPSLIVN